MPFAKMSASNALSAYTAACKFSSSGRHRRTGDKRAHLFGNPIVEVNLGGAPDALSLRSSLPPDLMLAMTTSDAASGRGSCCALTLGT